MCGLLQLVYFSRFFGRNVVNNDVVDKLPSILAFLSLSLNVKQMLFPSYFFLIRKTHETIYTCFPLECDLLRMAFWPSLPSKMIGFPLVN